LFTVVCTGFLWLLTLNLTKVQYNLDGRTNSGFEFHGNTSADPGTGAWYPKWENPRTRARWRRKEAEESTGGKRGGWPRAFIARLFGHSCALRADEHCGQLLLNSRR